MFAAPALLGGPGTDENSSVPEATLLAGVVAARVSIAIIAPCIYGAPPFAFETGFLVLRDVSDRVRRIGSVLLDARWTRVPAFGFHLVALPAERHDLIEPDLLDVGRYILVVIIAVTGHDRTFAAAPGADLRVAGLVRGGCFDPFR
jgi:hypothetical protein